MRLLSDEQLRVSELDEGALSRHQMMAALVSTARGRRRYQRVKRVLDVLVASILLILLSWLLLLIAVAILLDSAGPVVFQQVRIGRNGRQFMMLKFRTMQAERRERNVGPPRGADERRRRHKSIG